MDKSVILQLAFKAIDEVNGQMDKNHQIEKLGSTVIFGMGGKLDSLGLVNFIVALEEIINDELGAEIMLADERAMALESSPFRTVDTLVEYILALLKENEDAK